MLLKVQNREVWIQPYVSADDFSPIVVMTAIYYGT